MESKHILGLDLGTTSIGWASVIEGETPETSTIKQIGVRVNPLTVDEQTNFEKGKPFSINKDRTLKRGARRNLDRYQDRRKHLINLLLEAKIITEATPLTEIGKNTTHATWAIRAKAASEKIALEDFARVLLAINKKRGYKSSRKAKNDDEGQAIDGMSTAIRLYEEGITPGQLVFDILKTGKKNIPDFYRSDLQAEFDKVWNFQKQFHPEILTDNFYNELQGKGQRATSALFWTTYKFNTADIKDLEDSLKTEKTVKLNLRDKKKLQAYKWRAEAVEKELGKEEMAYVLTEINNNLNNSSGYLGAISDRSKELYFNHQTVGQYLYEQLKNNPHTSLKNQVFYRQDYLDEFEKIWETQAQFYPQLTKKLKEEIRNTVIFYQRKLKSQKGLISFCEFESKEIELEKDGKRVKKTIGLRVAPKSSLLFQEFKIWQRLNDIEVRNKNDKKDKRYLDQEEKEVLFEELNLKGNFSTSKALSLLFKKPKELEMNFKDLEGNRTNQALYDAYLKIIDLEGYDAKDLLKVKSNKDEVELKDLSVPATEIKEMVKSIFEVLKINTEILEFNAELDGKEFERQASYQLWHLLYSYEGDNSKSGNEKLYELLQKKFGFAKAHAQILANVSLQDDYGRLSTKAMRKIYPFIKENQFSTACELAGYRHSKNSLTKEELENRVLKPHLEILKKNSLRQPVVEKILNQMVNVVNALIDKENDQLEAEGKPRNFHFDEIRIELARELKKNAKERGEMTTNINAAKTAHEKIIKLLQSEFGLKNPTRNDIIRYRLYEELKNNSYKDLYTNTYIPREILFSKQVDIEHIIPQSKLFDDSFSNKTVVYRKDNLDKGNQTAFDYIESKQGENNLSDFISRIEKLYKSGDISKAKFQKLIKRENEIGDGFIERDLRESQYIAKKAKEMLFQITRSVVSTSGQITDRLRDDWGLINVMKEMNLPKYRALGLTEMQERKYGQQVEVIKDWTKRNDHRHHAMDALTIAFTKHNHIQYLNYLNARKNENHKLHSNIIAIEAKETELREDNNGNKKRIFKEPIQNFRQVAKEHLEAVIISHKAKNKVVTKNKNKISGKNKAQITLTPRGQLHKETIYGKYQYYVSKEEKISAKFDEETINKVANPLFRKLLSERLAANGNDPKKAFAGKNALSKNPIYLDSTKTRKLPEKVKLTWLEEDYSIRKEIVGSNPTSKQIVPNYKSIEKILDKKIRDILRCRLDKYNGDAKKAFSNLDKDPIWLNEEKGISIKRVTISGVKNAEPLHFQKDHQGKYILDENGKKIPTDYVSTGNNHHVAVYRDSKGKLQERVVSFYEAVLRKNYGLPIIFKHPMKNIDMLLEQGIVEPIILNNLPEKDWEFLFSMKQNELFVFPNEKTGFNPADIDLLDPENKKLISPNLFRVQKFSKVTYGNSAVREYVFRHHLETNVDENKHLKGISYKNIKSLGYFESIIKVRTNHLGDIVSVGEY